MSTKGSAESYIEMRGSISIPTAIVGKSAYEIAVSNGFDGTEEEWLLSLKGAKIVKTELIGQDENGGNIYRQTFDNGVTNEFVAPKGDKGETGEKGDTGEKGADGAPGKDGADGAPGKDGANGEDGITPRIGDNGNWFIGDEDTGVAAGGNGGGSAELPIFDLVALGAKPIEIGKGQTLNVDTTEIMAALDKGLVTFVLEIVRDSGTIRYHVTPIMQRTETSYHCYYINKGTGVIETISVVVTTGMMIVGASQDAIGGEEYEIPTFDLVELGLPTIVFGGETVLLETDTTDIMAALDKGAVKFIVGFAETQAEVVMNSVGVQGGYICTYMLNSGAPIILTLMFVEGAIQGYLAEIASGGGVTSWNDLTDKPFEENEDGTVKQLDNKYLKPFELQAGDVNEFLPSYTAANVFNSSLSAFNIVVSTDEATYNAFLENTKPMVIVYDGVEYICEVHTLQGTKYLGNGVSLGGAGNNEPFAIMCRMSNTGSGNAYYWLVVSTVDTASTEHTVRVYQSTPDKWLLKEQYLPDGIGGAVAQPVSIDLSGLETNGTIVETYADGTTKTTTIEYDANGNPTKITDGDGNVTTLTW